MRTKIEKMPIPVVILLGVVLTGVFIATLAGTGRIVDCIPGIATQSEYLLQTLAEIGELVIFLIILKVLGHMEILKENKAGWLKSLYVAGFFVVYCIFNIIAQIYVIVMSKFDSPQAPIDIFHFVCAMAMIGFVEELVFRGVILNLFLDRFEKSEKGLVASILLSGLLFGSMHFANIMAGGKLSSVFIQVVSATCLGILFGTVYAMTRNFWLVVAIHSLIDFGSLLSSGLYKSGGMVAKINQFSAVNLIGIVVLSIPCFVLLRKNNRKKLVSIYAGQELVIDEAEADKLGTVSLIVGIISIVIACVGYTLGLGVVGVIAALLSNKAKPQNNGKAIAGLVTSIVGIVLAFIMIFVMSFIYQTGFGGTLMKI